MRSLPLAEPEHRKQFERFEAESGASRTPEEKERLFREFLSAATSKRFLESEGPDFQNALSNVYGVVSLTADPYSRLMWAHYADAHTGFVAEFYHEEFEFEGAQHLITPFGPARKVAYAASIEPVDRRAADVWGLYCTKHCDWTYEQEWRVIRPLADSSAFAQDKKTFYLVSFAPARLLRVIVGLRASKALKRSLTDMLNKPEFASVRKEAIKMSSRGDSLISEPVHEFA